MNHDKAGVSACYNNLGKAYLSLGDFRKAIEYCEKSLAIAVEIEDRDRESACYSGLGSAYKGLGEFKKAIEYHEKSLAIAVEIEDRDRESACYDNLGTAYTMLGDLREAVECHEKAMAISVEIGDRARELSCHNNLGNAHNELGDYRNAIDHYEKSLAFAVEIGDRASETICYSNLGNACYRLGDSEQAIKYYEKSLEMAVAAGNLYLERMAGYGLGLVHLEEKPDLAYAYWKRSLELSEALGERLVEEEHKTSFQATVSDAYEYMVPLCLKLGKEEEAFGYVEHSKSRAFLDLLAATEIKPTVELTSGLGSLLHNEEMYLAELREIQTRHLRPTRGPAEPGEVEYTLMNLNLIYEEVEKLDPEYVFMRRGKPLSFEMMLDTLSSQKREMTLIEYFITEEETLVFAVSSRDRELHVVTVPLSRERLGRFFDNYWREVVEYSHFGDIGDTWLGLSDYLIEPISEFLTEGDLIYFVPHGPLHYLPLHALELRGEPLIKEHPVSYTPSASLIQFCQNKGSSQLQSCASFGVVFEEESRDVARLFDTQSYGRATKDTVLANCTNRDVIHFSCHGYFDYVDPLSSGVVLHDDKVLTAREIFDMKLNTELVTLSACQTGLSERSPGDELIGLTRAFLYAGSPSVIVSLWSVDARSTYELMIEFYTLMKNGEDKATALQKAQKKIMEKKEYSHPYYWAPFALVGDWQLAR